jgi:hypothetical protein
MNVCITNFSMHEVGGTQSWVFAIASGLRKLGHTPYCMTLRRGYSWLRYHDELPLYTMEDAMHMPVPDALIFVHPLQFEQANEFAAAWEWFRKQYPMGKRGVKAPPIPDIQQVEQRVYVCLGWAWPDYPKVGVGPYVTMSEECREYLRFLSIEAEVIHCPANLDRFKPGPPLREKPVVFAASSRRLPYDLIRRVCAKLGYTWLEPVAPRPIPHLDRWINKADIVIGTEYVMIEALACNRAAFVAAPWGWEGWITPHNVEWHARYSQSGRGAPRPYSEADLAEALAQYDHRAPVGGRALCEQHYSPVKAAQRLLEIACGSSQLAA